MRSGVWIALAVAVAGMLAHSVHLRPWTLDDAYISFRYSENFAHGDGLVYNPGERVEGYTNFLWVAALGLAHAVGLPTPAAARGLGTLCALACLALVAVAHRFHPGFTLRARIAAVLLLGAPGIFTIWVMSGMEVTLAALALLAASLLHLRSRSGMEPWLGAASGACCAAAAMTHPDLGLLAVVLLADRLHRGPRSWGPFVAALAAIYLPYFAWRYAYYGWLLPNTFYCKVGGTWDQVLRGFEYVGGFAWPALPLVALGLVGGLVRRVWLPKVVLGYAVLHTVYLVLVGGDVMPAFRFFAPLAPLGCLLAALALDGLVPRRRRFAAVVALMMAFSVGQSLMNPDLHRRVKDDVVSVSGSEVGTWLREHAPAHAVVSTNTAGSVAYFSGLTTIDALGLNDVHIGHMDVPMGKGPAGHEKHDGKYVLDREPDYIQFGSARGSVKPRFAGDREIARDPRFREHYELVKIELTSGKRAFLYRRID